MKTRTWAAAALFIGAQTIAAPSGAQVPLLGELRAAAARDAIIELDVEGARKILEGADESDPSIALERARLALHEGDYAGASALLTRPDLAGSREGAELTAIARGALRATAGTVLVLDEANGVSVRLQDDDDGALVPTIVDVVVRARDMLAKELGVELPRPLRIELVRDQFTLAAMTGLPEEAAQTTGTVAVAKWGRVTMLSPRAMRDGYPWLDTLVHEMTHLALTRGTRDKAPLWLQEGVAKRQEVRWREPEPFDDVPPVDAVAQSGIERGLGVAIDKMGPSIAMLPSAEQASVAFAEVSSFIRYWAREAGDDALPQLIVRLKAADRASDIDRAIAEVSNADFATWDKRWRAHLASSSRDVAADLMPGAVPKNMQEISRRYRLGELLLGRGHAREAAIQHARAQALAPSEATLRCALAAALLAQSDGANAAPFVERASDVHDRMGRWWSLHGLFFPEGPDASRAYRLGVALDPLDPHIACEEKLPPALPSEALRAALCDAARRVPR